MDSRFRSPRWSYGEAGGKDRRRYEDNQGLDQAIYFYRRGWTSDGRRGRIEAKVSSETVSKVKLTPFIVVLALALPLAVLAW